MKKSVFLSVMMLVAVAFTFNSCSKYDEGSKFTLLTKKMRMVNTWKLTKVTSNGTDVTSFMPNVVLDIKKDDTYTLTYTAGSISTTDNGTWAFSSDKLNLILTSSNSNNGVQNFKIIMLKNKELKLQDADNTSSVDIYYFEQQ